MNIVSVNAIEIHFFDDDFFTVGCIFNKSFCIKGALAHGKIVTFSDGPEIIQGDLLDLEVAVEGDMWLGEKVGMGFQLQSAGIENNRFHFDRRRVSALLGMDIADILSDKIDLLNLQWWEWTFVYVGDVPVPESPTG